MESNAPTRDPDAPSGAKADATASSPSPSSPLHGASPAFGGAPSSPFGGAPSFRAPTPIEPFPKSQTPAPPPPEAAVDPDVRPSIAEPSSADEAKAAAAPEPAVPKVEGPRYNRVRRLGQGATADVHLAYSPAPDDPDRVVALKCARADLVGTVGLGEMFAHEAQLLARFHHPNVVRLFEHGVDLDPADPPSPDPDSVGDAARPYLVLEYLNGQTLADVLNAAVERDVTIPVGVVCRLGVAALAGLDHIHGITDLDGEPLGVVHCDVSPHNLFVTYGGDLKLLDFGFTQSNESERAYDIKGRIAYSAPEVLAGEPFDARADVFSLGSILWELIARVRLWKRGSDEHTRDAIRHGHVPSLVARAASCPDDLEEIIKRAVARAPEDRYPSAAAMRDALLQFLADQSALLEDNVVASFMTDLFGAKRRDAELARERAAARQNADSEPPTLLRTPPPIELEAAADELSISPRRSVLTPKPVPVSVLPAAPAAELPTLDANVVAPAPIEPRSWQRELEAKSPLGRYTVPSLIALAIVIALALVTLR